MTELEGKSSVRSPLTREQELVVGRVLASKPLPSRPRRFRFEWVSVFGGLAFVVALIIAWVLWLLAGHGTSVVPFLAVGTAFNLLFSLVIAPMIRRRSVAFVRRHEGFICPRCHYPLGSLPDVGQCPECGTMYTRAQVVDMWKWRYKLKDAFSTHGKTG